MRKFYAIIDKKYSFTLNNDLINDFYNYDSRYNRYKRIQDPLNDNYIIKRGIPHDLLKKKTLPKYLREKKYRTILG